MASELEGVKELTQKLNRLDSALLVKNLRSVLFKATTPVVRRIKAKMPVGTEAHRTYKGRLVAPGFAKRSIKRLTGKKFLSRGKISIAIGTRAEAFYAAKFYDQGPYTVTRRRQSTNIKARGHFGNQRRYIRVKPYTLKKHPFFQSIFIQSENLMLKNVNENLKSAVDKALKNR